jgi:hypothetical protein
MEWSAITPVAIPFSLGRATPPAFLTTRQISCMKASHRTYTDARRALWIGTSKIIPRRSPSGYHFWQRRLILRAAGMPLDTRQYPLVTGHNVR